MLTYENKHSLVRLKYYCGLNCQTNLKGQSYTALSKKMNYGRTVKFFGCQMKQGMDALQSIRFFLVLSFTITICTWDIAIKIKLQLNT